MLKLVDSIRNARSTPDTTFVFTGMLFIICIRVGCIIYTNKDGYYDYIYGRLGLYPLWICSFSEVPISAEWTFWQYNHRGRVKGIKGDVDLNVFSGSEKEWVEFIGLPADEYDK